MTIYVAITTIQCYMNYYILLKPYQQHCGSPLSLNNCVLKVVAAF